MYTWGVSIRNHKQAVQADMKNMYIYERLPAHVHPHRYKPSSSIRRLVPGNRHPKPGGS
jgi:hypothetical protein